MLFGSNTKPPNLNVQHCEFQTYTAASSDHPGLLNGDKCVPIHFGLTSKLDRFRLLNWNPGGVGSRGKGKGEGGVPMVGGGGRSAATSEAASNGLADEDSADFAWQYRVQHSAD